MLNVGIFPAVSNVFLQLSKAELFLHFKNVEMFPIHFRNAGIFLALFKCVSAVVKSGIVPTFKKNVEMFPTFWKCRKFPTFFKCVSAVVKS